MNILVTGGTGFIGSVLCARLIKQGHSIVIKTRTPQIVKPPLKAISDLSQLSDDVAFHIVINLAGEPIAQKRWSTTQKNKIKGSRLSNTAELVCFFKKAKHKPQLFISASAIGFYGISRSDEEQIETSTGDNSFSSDLCSKWEEEALSAQALGIRTCILRIGIVLGDNGGALKKILPPFKCGVGGNIGSGKQWMSWIHLNDLVSIIEYCIQTETIEGTLNCTAPHPVKNEDFTKVLAKMIKRPGFFHMPSFIVRMLFGEMGNELLVAGKKVVPEKLNNSEFTFKYPTLASALENILLNNK